MDVRLAVALTCTMLMGSGLAIQTAASAEVARHAKVGDNLMARLEVDKKNRGYLRVTDPSDRVVKRVKLVTHQQVLPLLIDRRFEPLWPELLEWTGPSLEKLRARMLADSNAAFARGDKAYGEVVAVYTFGKAGAVQERAMLLAIAGSPERAVALLRDATGKWPDEKGWGKYEQALLLTQLAALLFERGEQDEADRVLASAPDQLGPGSHLLNVMATHGLHLAEAGKYQKTLEVVEGTASQYRAHAKTIGGMLRTIPGSERYFAMIRGCALSGLGRREEAQAALQPAKREGEPRSLAQKVLETNSEVRLRAYLCLRDADAVAAEVVQSVSDDLMGPRALLLMQPNYTGEAYHGAVLAAARQNPAVVAALAPIARPLPPELVPALNDWTP